MPPIIKEEHENGAKRALETGALGKKVFYFSGYFSRSDR